jgi:putative tricarboxylic transport membrane protein
LSRLSLLAPDGRDAFAGSLRSVIEADRLARVDVTETSPAAASAGLGRRSDQPREPQVMVAGPGLVAEAAAAPAGRVLARTTPLARLVGEWEVLVASPRSRFRTFEAFAAALRRDPAALPVAGRAVGGPDHVLFGLVAQGLGMDVRLLSYAAYADASQVVSALADARIAVGVGGLRDLAGPIRAGALRALAVSAGDRVPGVDAPTLKESGVRLEYADWRGLVGPAGLGEADRAALCDLCRAVAAAPAWQRADWVPMHLEGDDFARWLDTEVARTRAVLADLGTL